MKTYRMQPYTTNHLLGCWSLFVLTVLSLHPGEGRSITSHLSDGANFTTANKVEMIDAALNEYKIDGNSDHDVLSESELKEYKRVNYSKHDVLSGDELNHFIVEGVISGDSNIREPQAPRDHRAKRAARCYSSEV